MHEGLPSSAITAQGRIGHCLAKDNETLVERLERSFGLAREDGERLLAFGAVYESRRRTYSNCLLSAGQYIRVHFQPKRFPVTNIAWERTVVHHEVEFVVANKPAGIPVHATVDNGAENVLHQLGAALGTSLHITQRLDTAVSGLLVIAKTKEFQRRFNRLLVERKVTKRYRALVLSAPEVGRHVHYMEPNERSPKTVSASRRPNWQACALTVTSVTSTDLAVSGSRAFEIEIDLETGRTHQIRAQLAAMGSPIVGDDMYGSRTRYEIKGTPRPGLALFSASTSWPNRDGREWSFTLATPWQEARVAAVYDRRL